MPELEWKDHVLHGIGERNAAALLCHNCAQGLVDLLSIHKAIHLTHSPALVLFLHTGLVSWLPRLAHHLPNGIMR
eukprot:scaffold207_cov409-Prasinococcus_capsulatus_cf.AAC.107